MRESPAGGRRGVDAENCGEDTGEIQQEQDADDGCKAEIAEPFLTFSIHGRYLHLTLARAV